MAGQRTRTCEMCWPKQVLRSKTSGASRIEAEHLDPEPGSFPLLSFKEAKDKAAEEWSKGAIRTALALTEGNISKAAVLLKMNQNALFRLIKSTTSSLTTRCTTLVRNSRSVQS